MKRYYGDHEAGKKESRDRQARRRAANPEAATAYSYHRYLLNKEAGKIDLWYAASMADPAKREAKNLAVRNWRLKNATHRKGYRRWYNSTPAGRLVNRSCSHRRRARLRDNGVEPYRPVDLLGRYESFGNCCAYCGKRGKLVIEHFIPISRGGEDSLRNIVPACRECNSAKYNHDPLSWFSRQPFYSTARWFELLDSTVFASLRVLECDEMPLEPQED